MSKVYSEGKLGIYVHIPYCLRKCPYCAFNSYKSPGVPAGYTAAVTAEVNYLASLFRLTNESVDTVYFGGGTPSLLEPHDLTGIMEELGRVFQLNPDCEVTLEVNPSSANEEKLGSYRKAGVNRLSIGIQSFNDRSLTFLGRLHNSATAINSFRKARDAGFDNISIDIIFAMPMQSRDEFLGDLQEAASLDPEHISLYMFTIEEGTPMHLQAGIGKISMPDDSVQEGMFLTASAYLKGKGFTRYETSNYAKDGFEARHNLGYWCGKDYIGLGSGAHSYLSGIGWGVRWWNLDAPEDYSQTLRGGGLPICGLEILSRREAVREHVFNSLRTKAGLREENLKELLGAAIHEVISESAAGAIPEGLTTRGERCLSLTDRGALMADEIAARIII